MLTNHIFSERFLERKYRWCKEAATNFYECILSGNIVQSNVNMNHKFTNINIVVVNAVIEGKLNYPIILCISPYREQSTVLISL